MTQNEEVEKRVAEILAKQEKTTSERKHGKPIKSFRAGTVQVAIWENAFTDRTKEFKVDHKITFDKRYKTSDGSWKSTNSLFPGEIPTAILLLSKAFEYLKLDIKEDADETQDD